MAIYISTIYISTRFLINFQFVLLYSLLYLSLKKLVLSSIFIPPPHSLTSKPPSYSFHYPDPPFFFSIYRSLSSLTPASPVQWFQRKVNALVLMEFPILLRFDIWNEKELQYYTFFTQMRKLQVGCRVQRRTQNLPEVCIKYTVNLRAAHSGLNPLLQGQKGLLTGVFSFSLLANFELTVECCMKEVHRSLINGQSINNFTLN